MACACPLPGVAAEPADDLLQLSLEALADVRVYSASKFVQKLSEAPSSVTVITAADIKAFGYRKLADILRSIPGLYGAYDRNYDFIGVRGFERPGDYNSRILLLVDGIRLNENIYTQAGIGTEFIVDVDLIDRVEFVPGPGSSIYGSSAFFGVINVFTKRGADLRAAEVSAEVASAHTHKERISYGRRFDNGLDWIVSASNLDSGGRDLYFPQYAAGPSGEGTAHGLDYDRVYSIFSKASFQGFTLEGAYVSREKGIPTGAYGTLFDDPRSRATDAHGMVAAQYSGALSARLELLARAYYRQYAYDGLYPYRDPASGEVIENVDGSRGKWGGAELKFIHTGFARHKIVYGVEYERDAVQRQFNYDNAPYISYADSRPQGSRYAGYLQDEYAIRDDLVINAGARFDQGSSFDGIVSPRIALLYSPTQSTTLKLLYGSAFRAPNVYERYYTQTDLWKGTPDLQPERIKTYEAVLEHSLARNLRVSASVFTYHTNGLIDQAADPDQGSILFRNVAQADARGGQVVAEGQWENGVRGRLSYSMQRAQDEDTGARLTNSPLHLAKLNVSAPLPLAGLRGGLETFYTSARKTLFGEVGGYSVTNVTLRTAALARGIEVSFSVYNLFDAKYADPTSETAHAGLDSIPQDGRSVRLGLAARF